MVWRQGSSSGMPKGTKFGPLLPGVLLSDRAHPRHPYSSARPFGLAPRSRVFGFCRVGRGRACQGKASTGAHASPLGASRHDHSGRCHRRQGRSCREEGRHANGEPGSASGECWLPDGREAGKRHAHRAFGFPQVRSGLRAARRALGASIDRAHDSAGIEPSGEALPWKRHEPGARLATPRWGDRSACVSRKRT